MSDVKELPQAASEARVRPASTDDSHTDRHSQWSSATLASHRRGDVTEPVSLRVAALLRATMMSSLR